MADCEHCAALQRQNDLLANDRDGYVQLLTNDNNKLRAEVERLKAVEADYDLHEREMIDLEEDNARLTAEIAWHVEDKNAWQDTQTAHLREVTRLTARVKELEGVLLDGVFVLDDLTASRVDDEVLTSLIDEFRAALSASQPAPEKADTGTTWWDNPDTYGAS